MSTDDPSAAVRGPEFSAELGAGAGAHIQARANASALRTLPMARPAPDNPKRAVPGLWLARGVRMSPYLIPCPFCGEAPRMTSRPDNLMNTEFSAAVACYCGGYSACAYKMAIAPTQAEADELACAAWNSRKTPNAEITGRPLAGPVE